jgi:hypothetical protein
MEELLIDRINNLSMRQMPPTSHIVKNMAEEIYGRAVGKNWTGQFINRHKSRLHSMYLRNIDNLRAPRICADGNIGDQTPSNKITHRSKKIFSLRCLL